MSAYAKYKQVILEPKAIHNLNQPARGSPAAAEAASSPLRMSRDGEPRAPLPECEDDTTNVDGTPYVPAGEASAYGIVPVGDLGHEDHQDNVDGTPYVPAGEASAYGIVTVGDLGHEDHQDNEVKTEQVHATSTAEGGPLPPSATLVDVGDGSSLECSAVLDHEPTTYHQLQGPTSSYKDVSSDDSCDEATLTELVYGTQATTAKDTCEKQPSKSDEPVQVNEPEPEAIQNRYAIII